MFMLLQVRRNSAVIDMPILQEAMVKIKLGLPEAPLPDRCPPVYSPNVNPYPYPDLKA